MRIASLQDVIRSKSAAARPKDLRALPGLLRLAAGQSPDDALADARAGEDAISVRPPTATERIAAARAQAAAARAKDVGPPT